METKVLGKGRQSMPMTLLVCLWIISLNVASGSANIASLHPIVELIGENHSRDAIRRLKKEDKLVPSPAPSTLREEPFQLTTEHPSLAPTAGVSSSPSEHLYEVALLPFSFLVHGRITQDQRFDIQQKIQEYLLDEFNRKSGEREFEALFIELELTRVVESYLPTVIRENVETEEGDDNKKQRHRRGLRSQWRRVKSDWSESTTSTMLEYEGTVFGRFRGEAAKCEVCTQIAIQQNQIETLENSIDLQEHFLEWFSSSIEQGKNESDAIRPVVLIETRVADRPPNVFDFKETWEEIETTHGIGANDQTKVKQKPFHSTDQNDEDLPDNINVSSIDKPTIRTKKSSSQMIAVSIGCSVMVLAGLLLLLLARRRKHLNLHSMNESASNEEAPKDKSNLDETDSAFNTSMNTGKNTSFESSNSRTSPVTNIPAAEAVIDLTTPGTRNADGFQVIQTEGSGKSSFKFSPTSLFQNSTASESKRVYQTSAVYYESDSVAGKSNGQNTSLNDDESMMGYSLTSTNRENINNKAYADDANTIDDLDETLSDGSSVSQGGNMMIASVEKFFHTPLNEPSDSLSNRPSQDRMQLAPRIEKACHVQPVQSSRQETRSRKGVDECEPSRIISKTLVEESDENIEIWKLGRASKKNLFEAYSNPTKSLDHDDASDAPSDERNGGRLNPSLGQNVRDRTGIDVPGPNTNTGVESDPAVIQYLARERVGIMHR